MFPFFFQAYSYLYLVLNILVFQNSSRVFGGRFSSIYMIVLLSVRSGMILLMVMSVSARLLDVFLCSLLWKVMTMFSGVVFELLAFVVLIVRMQVKSFFVMVMFLMSAILRMMSFRSSFLVMGMFRIMTCFSGSCMGLGWCE